MTDEIGSKLGAGDADHVGGLDQAVAEHDPVSASGRLNVLRAPRAARRTPRAALLSRLLAMALAMSAQQAWSATCTLNVQGVSFGTYDTFGNVAVDSAGNIAVSCDVATAYAISLSPGGGSYASRAMASGAHTLNYNLYSDAARTIVWGDGTGGTATVSGNATSANHTVYGRIPPAQNAYVGSYSDSITVTLTF